MLSGTRLAAPLLSPFGPFLVDPTTAIALPLPLVLDGTGYALTGTVPVPAITVSFWCQGASLNFTTSVVSTSDACRVQIAVARPRSAMPPRGWADFGPSEIRSTRDRIPFRAALPCTQAGLAARAGAQSTAGA